MRSVSSKCTKLRLWAGTPLEVLTAPPDLGIPLGELTVAPQTDLLAGLMEDHEAARGGGVCKSLGVSLKRPASLKACTASNSYQELSGLCVDAGAYTAAASVVISTFTTEPNSHQELSVSARMCILRSCCSSVALCCKTATC